MFGPETSQSKVKVGGAGREQDQRQIHVPFDSNFNLASPREHFQLLGFQKRQNQCFTIFTLIFFPLTISEGTFVVPLLSYLFLAGPGQVLVLALD